MSAPQGWTREWINDECYCSALAVYQWVEVDASGSTYRPQLRALHWSRSLFCGSDHADEVERWARLIDSDAAASLEQRFAMQGNREGAAG